MLRTQSAILALLLESGRHMEAVDKWNPDPDLPPGAVIMGKDQIEASEMASSQPSHCSLKKKSSHPREYGRELCHPQRHEKCRNGGPHHTLI